MIKFEYTRSSDVADAVRQHAADPMAKFIAGGTNLLDLMKDDIERPSPQVAADTLGLPLESIDIGWVIRRCLSRRWRADLG